MTNVTIRGIEDETYLQFSAEATLRGMSIGDLTTQAMRTYLELNKGPVYRISNMDKLTITRHDLESIDGSVKISNVAHLEFDPDIDWPMIKERIQMIENVDEMLIPKNVSKFQILTRVKNVARIKTI